MGPDIVTRFRIDFYSWFAHFHTDFRRKDIKNLANYQIIVNEFRKRVNLFSESSQLISGKTVNHIQEKT